VTQLPHAFKRIRLELARSKEFPNGSANHGYEFIAPLDATGHIDATLWQKHREKSVLGRRRGDRVPFAQARRARARALDLRLSSDNTT
jgi:hypothetical protein